MTAGINAQLMAMFKAASNEDFVDAGSCGTNQSSTANQASFTITMTQNVEVDTVLVVGIAADNAGTTDGDEGAVTSISSTGNTFSKLHEHANTNGAAQAGAVVSLWFCHIDQQINSGATITVNLSNSTSRDKTCATTRKYTLKAGLTTVSEEGTSAGASNDNFQPQSANVTTANQSCLRIRMVAQETNSSTFTPTSGWTAFTQTNTTGGGSAANMLICGEFLISTGTGAASDPSASNADTADVYACLKAA